MNNWKFKVWISFIVITAVGLMFYFSYLAIVDMGQAVVILPASEYAQSFK